MSELMQRFRSDILGATNSDILADPTLAGRLILEHSGPLTVSYAPFEHIQRNARVVIVGSTPGAQQASNALIELRRSLLVGTEVETCLATAKAFASFSGPMRRNLVDMLDHIGLARWLGIEVDFRTLD